MVSNPVAIKYHVHMVGWYANKNLFAHLEVNVPVAYGTAKCNILNSPKTLEKMKCVPESTRSKETETS